MDLHKGGTSTANGNYIGKYIRFFFYYINYCKGNDSLNKGNN